MAEMVHCTEAVTFPEALLAFTLEFNIAATF